MSKWVICRYTPMKPKMPKYVWYKFSEQFSLTLYCKLAKNTKAWIQCGLASFIFVNVWIPHPLVSSRLL